MLGKSPVWFERPAVQHKAPDFTGIGLVVRSYAGELSILPKVNEA